MSPKKKKRPAAAQQLIDSLLDEKTPEPFSPLSGVSKDLSFLPTPAAESPAKSPRKSPTDSPEKPTEQQELEATRTRFPDEAVFINVSESELRSNLQLDEPAGRLPRPKSAEPEKTIRLDTASKKQSASSFSRSDPTLFDTSSRGIGAPSISSSEEVSVVDPRGLTDLKTVVKIRDRQGRGSQQAPSSTLARPAGQHGPFASSEAALRQSESMRVAQNRISELETELERLRRENEKLSSAGETLARRSDELVAKVEGVEQQKRDSERIFDEEKKVIRGQLQAKDKDISELKNKLEDLETRLENNFKKIRVRERELEHRLEIARMESSTLTSSKDKTILELKRQIDQLTHENDYGKQKSQELYNQYREKQETARRVVRALRIALTILEGDDDLEVKKPD